MVLLMGFMRMGERGKGIEWEEAWMKCQGVGDNMNDVD